MAGVKGKSGGDRKSAKARGVDLEKLPPLLADKDEIGELIRTLEAAPKADEAEKNPRAASWRRFWDSINLSVALHTRIFLYEQWRGKARHVQSVEVSGKNVAPIPVVHIIRFGDGKSDVQAQRPLAQTITPTRKLLP